MKSLLDPEFFRKRTPHSELKKLCLNIKLDQEIEFFYTEYHKLALLELLKQWDKVYRKNNSEEQSGDIE